MFQFILFLIICFNRNKYGHLLLGTGRSLLTSGKTSTSPKEFVSGFSASPSMLKSGRHIGLFKIYSSGFFSSRITRYPNSTSSFQLQRLMVSGDISLNPGPNAGLGEGRRGETMQKQQSHVKIAHLNTHSIKNRHHYILVKEVLCEHQFDILTINETWLDASVSDVEIEIPGYDIYRLDRSSMVGGGVSAYIRQNFKVERLDNVSYIALSGLHMLRLKVQVGNLRSFVVCAAYRPPTTSLACFETDFSHTLTSVLLMNKKIYILGDLNCNVLNTRDQASQALSNFCSIFNLAQLITQATRVTESSATLLDVILASSTKLVIESNLMPISISDHDLIYVVLKLKKGRHKEIHLNIRIFRHYDPNLFRQDVSQVPWSVGDVFDEVDDKLHVFNLLLHDLLD